VKIGRSSTNDLMIDDSRLSREHARIDTINDRCVTHLPLLSLLLLVSPTRRSCTYHWP
jgi:hypothetical protein